MTKRVQTILLTASPETETLVNLSAQMLHFILEKCTFPTPSLSTYTHTDKYIILILACYG